MTGTAAQRWRDELEAWRIAPELLASVSESPYHLPPELFAADDRTEDTPARQRALEVLTAGGSVLDVGCGAGAASLTLAPPAGRITGVDASADMLAAFAADADRRGVAHAEVCGVWPDVEDAAPDADVVVCSHVIYNVAPLGPFAQALTAHARRRVVVDCTVTHPWVPIGPLWRHFHGEGRPDGPTAELAVAVLGEVGIRPTVECWERPHRSVERDAVVATTRRRLCLPPEREPEVDALLGDDPRLTVRDCVTLWWNV